jgi:hypothetical protein
MRVSACASFEAGFPPDSEFKHPEGCYFARQLSEGLRLTCPDVGSFDNWRDCGWYVPCRLDEASLWVFFARYSKAHHWELVVAPRKLPGPLARLLGHRRPRYVDSLKTVSDVVDRVLKQEPVVTNVRWALNARPDQKGPTSPDLLTWPPV